MDWPYKRIALQSGIRALAGGTGTAVVLLPGWPQTAEAYSVIAPSLTEQHELLVMDLPGLGDSAASNLGYDTASISRLLNASVDSILADRAYHLVGHDVGAWVAYAWAAQFPARLLSLTMLDASLPGCSPEISFPLSNEANLKLWQFSFNALPDLPELLTRGKERELLNWMFAQKAKFPERISEAHRDRYVDCYSRPGAMSQGFAYYRAVAESAVQNARFCQKKLQMPVLALGGEDGVGDSLHETMTRVADDVEGGIVRDCGHYLLEEQPEILARQLLAFFKRSQERQKV